MELTNFWAHLDQVQRYKQYNLFFLIICIFIFPLFSLIYVIFFLLKASCPVYFYRKICVLNSVKKKEWARQQLNNCAFMRWDLVQNLHKRKKKSINLIINELHGQSLCVFFLLLIAFWLKFFFWKLLRTPCS